MQIPQTPLERLLSDKGRIQHQCKQQEEKLNADFTYIQENAADLLLSGLSSLLFHGGKSTPQTTQEESSAVQNASSPVTLELSDYLTMAKGMIPIAWDFVRPIIVSWGIGKAKRWIASRLFKRKK